MGESKNVSWDRSTQLLEQACWLATSFAIHRYLIANTSGRLDGAEKALRHLEMSKFYVALLEGCNKDEADRSHHEKIWRVHNFTQEHLTDKMDEVIGFPLADRFPDYDGLAKLFFAQFHELAIMALEDA